MMNNKLVQGRKQSSLGSSLELTLHGVQCRLRAVEAAADLVEITFLVFDPRLPDLFLIGRGSAVFCQDIIPEGEESRFRFGQVGLEVSDLLLRERDYLFVFSDALSVLVRHQFMLPCRLVGTLIGLSENGSMLA
eukprot:3934001-Rhodomonas_salina.3